MKRGGDGGSYTLYISAAKRLRMERAAALGAWWTKMKKVEDDSRKWTKYVCRKYHSLLSTGEWTTLLSSDDIPAVI
eukprot:2355435-Ditylum_brightwellii.AAC.1